MRDKKKSLELARAFEHVDARYLAIADQERKQAKHRGVRAWKVAAAACAALLVVVAVPAGAIASNWLGLRDLLIPVTPEPSEGVTPELSENAAPEPAERMDLIGLSGYAESPEAKALGEWQLFLSGYDKDGEILAQIGNNPSGLEGTPYSEYNVYTQEMADKLAEITQKYSLKLHTGYTDSWESDETREMMTKALPEEGHIFNGGYAYADGTFQFEGQFVTGDGRIIDYQLRRCAKGVFDEVLLNIGSVEDYQEKAYQTARGDEVTLANDPEFKSLIFADSEDFFITVNLLPWEVDSITEEDLRAFADSIDFAAIQNK